jgi:hypothetical protein
MLRSKKESNKKTNKKPALAQNSVHRSVEWWRIFISRFGISISELI